MQSNRYQGLKEWKEFKKLDSGYFADPARKSETTITSDTVPTFWSLLKQNRIGAASSFYPVFFWRTHSLTMIYVLLNLTHKKGIKYGFDLLGEYLGWKISSFLSRSISSIPEYISLRKLIRKKLIPEISGDNPSMATLRKGR